MNINLKSILKNLNVLFLTNKNNTNPIELNILKFFFNEVTVSHHANRALKIFKKNNQDIIIVDLYLEDSSGLDFCKKIRIINTKLPIIILSHLEENNILFEVIRLQVIDFVLRPIDMENLLFSLNQMAKCITEYGNITIELSNGFVYDYKEKTILQNENITKKLTKNEFKLLELLIVNKDKTLSKKEIESHIWANEEITSSAFKSLFSRLRNKIGKKTIKNSFGIGYQLT
jgi:DNA-binding response OmpR family regulator